MATDPELRRLYTDARRANETLVARVEGYQELVPSRANEADLLRDMRGFALFAERQFRHWYERCRDVREALEDEDLYPLPFHRTSRPSASSFRSRRWRYNTDQNSKFSVRARARLAYSSEHMFALVVEDGAQPDERSAVTCLGWPAP